MKFDLEIWSENDRKEFINFLNSLKSSETKCLREKLIVNTKLDCLAIPTPKLKDITKQIIKGNYLSFLDLWIWDNYSSSAIIGYVISSIKDFDVFRKYFDKYALYCDNWSNVDLVKFNVNENNKDKFFNLAKECLKSKLPFKRRFGIRIFFKFINTGYLSEIFSIINDFYEENEYYVLMAISWFLCECFIKQRDKTIEYLKIARLNNFVIKKFVSKCRDSFRVSIEDKEWLKNSIKNN